MFTTDNEFELLFVASDSLGLVGTVSDKLGELFSSEVVIKGESILNITSQFGVPGDFCNSDLLCFQYK